MMGRNNLVDSSKMIDQLVECQTTVLKNSKNIESLMLLTNIAFHFKNGQKCLDELSGVSLLYERYLRGFPFSSLQVHDLPCMIGSRESAYTL